MNKSAVLKLVIMFAVLAGASGQSSNGSQASKPVSRQSATSAQEISCPAPEVRTEITTRLPKPWWQTPQEEKLHAVAIQTIAGRETLVCRYRANGTEVSVMRLFPEGAHKCNAVSDHFVCR